MQSTEYLIFSLCLFIAMMLFLELGRLLGVRSVDQQMVSGEKAFGAVEGAVFALFGLLLAFSFSGASSRFDLRRELITQEANAIGTAYLRVDLLPIAKQAAIRVLFREYIEARIARFEEYANPELSQAENRKGMELQGKIWQLAVEGVNAAANPTVASQIIPALNDMFDISTTRQVALQTHPPTIIFVMLYGLGLVVSLLAGYGMAASKSRPWLHVIAFSIAITATVYVIRDIEHPRMGFIRIDYVDRLLVEVLKSMQ